MLNDRGVSLNNGDLLRARTLELLDHSSVTDIQDKVAIRWDSALAYVPSSIDNYLSWYFASYEGKRPKQSEVTDSFMNVRFSEPSLSKPITKRQATTVLNEVVRLDDDFVLLDQLIDGEWPYDDNSKLSQWDIQRLNFLVGHLKHTNAMPLLMALKLLDPVQFAESVVSLERFVFRYRTIGNAHISPATKVYHEHAFKIRSNPSGYKISSLRAALGELIEKYASENRFSTAISELTYSPRGGNGNIRYLLMAIEDYYQWYEEGAQGRPVCKDKTRILDITNTTLEHIYPQGLKSQHRDPDLEPVKHELGNLTVLGPGENGAVGNKEFADKKTAYKNSNLRLNRHIAENENWKRSNVKERTNLLAKMAEKIFVP